MFHSFIKAEEPPPLSPFAKPNIWTYGLKQFPESPLACICTCLIPCGACMIHGMALERATATYIKFQVGRSVTCTWCLDSIGLCWLGRRFVKARYKIVSPWYYELCCYMAYPCSVMQEYMETISRG